MREVIMAQEYQICSHCIMDTSDPDIIFDANGVCNHCKEAEKMINSILYDSHREEKLNKLVATIKADGEGKPYDCIIGVSGGVDSTYVAYLVKKLGLRPLAVHLDNGWDTEISVRNIEKTLEKLDIDLFTYVIDWEEFKDLQVSFLKASLPHCEHPTDHAIMAILHKVAKQQGLKYILRGSNISTESYGVKSWSGGQRDWKYIKSIHQLFGKVHLKTYPYMSGFAIFKNKYLYKQKDIAILDYVEYIKEEAMETLQKELGWTYYGGKHYESLFTKFFQAYILPVKFGYDKRRIHLSALIASGQITREQALEEMNKELYPETELKEDRVYVLKKLGLTEANFNHIMQLPVKEFGDYPSYENSWWFKWLYPFLKRDAF